MKLNFNRQGILAKLLWPISGISIVAMVILGYVVFQMQDKFTAQMGLAVTGALEATTVSVQKQFAAMEANVNQTLEKNLARAANTLSRNTSSELFSVESKIVADLEQNLRLNAESTATLMAQVAPRAMLSNNFADLVAYVKSVTLRPDVIYAVYLKLDGKPITRYINRQDPKIKSYIANGQGAKRLDKVLDASSRDKSVLIVETTMQLEGKALGKVVLCVDKTAIRQKSTAVAKQFAAITHKNEAMIDAVLEQISASASANMQATLKSIAAQSSHAWQQFGRNIERIGVQAKSKIKGVLLALGSVFGMAMLSVIGALIFLMVIKPMNQVIAGLQDIATGEGDLTKRLEIHSRDEISFLVRWFNQFVDNLQSIIRDLALNAGNMKSSSSDLSEISNQMSVGSQKTSDRANDVAAAGDQMRANMNSVAAAMEQATTNLNMVVGAVEEITATMNDIARHSEKAKNSTEIAVEQTDSTSTQVNKLGESAQKIDRVVETITEISEQVNLLALNATIEAARAGEAGKGFAVVANDIKELAKQTSESTREIKAQVVDIQSATQNTISKISGIEKVCNDVNKLVATIAAAIEEQSATTRETSGNLAQVTAGIREVNENVASTTTVASQVANDINEVRHAADEMATSSAQVNLNADQLAKTAEQLNMTVGQFHF